MYVGGLAKQRKLSKTTITSYIYVFLTQYFVAPMGHIQAPHCAPFGGHPARQLSPLLATWAGNDFTHREWAHTVRQRPPSTAGQRLVESQGSVSAGVRTSARSWDECKGRPLISGRRRTVWMTHGFVCEGSCGMSGMCDCPCTCVWFCFAMKCVCVCECACTRGQVGQVETYNMMWTLLIAHLCTVWLEVCVCVCVEDFL